MTAIITLIIGIAAIAIVALVVGVRVEVPPRAGPVSVQVGRVKR